MGKRKKAAKKPTGPKKNEPLATSFSCLFCNHEKAVTCKLDKKAGIGSLSCKVCGQTFQANINYLSHAIDVYSEWVDACDEVANPKEKSTGRSAGGGSGARSIQQSRGRIEGPDDDDDDDDLGGGGGGYGDMVGIVPTDSWAG
ncbi:uncharacterized protein LAJ45_06081 [Morchella importuna]|uniref:uncharacterized protein n=1 Tax=Morchella importuna TaxID=1174673 RepID=UPI001E8CA67B|nr:uncharacterized protein LAJ45_06081 [Morchella importuna]KAH8149929.1 hypothetical protein LAJ45_06081 [Morchella importuna]